MLEFCLRALIIGVIAYFCGCFNGAVIVSKYILRDDVRTHGSGNAGLTNFFRTFGGPLTLVVIACDVLKAVAAMLIGMLIMSSPSAAGMVVGQWPLYSAMGPGGAGNMYMLFSEYWAACFCLLGHMFPCMFGFKGGKGILSGGTIAIMIDWRVALVVWGGFLILTALTRYVSLGSLWAGASFPFASWAFVSHEMVIVILSVILGWGIVYMHRANIRRLLKGEENKLSFHKKKGENKS